MPTKEHTAAAASKKAAGQKPRARHDPPAFLSDFDDEQRKAWDELVRAFFTSALDGLPQKVRDGGGDPRKFVPQFFDPTTYAGDLVLQPVTWNAFPKELLVRFGRARALEEADRLWPIAAYFVNRFTSPFYDSDVAGGFVPGPVPSGSNPDLMARAVYRPTVEYCEWHVNRDPATGGITKVTFTSEPPEYWTAMWGGPFPGGGPTFPDGRRKVLALYRELVSPHVEIEDLISPYDDPSFGILRGGYNPYNKWNTTHGIVHLCAPPNSLNAEVELGAEATLRRIDGAGKAVTDPQTLVCCAAFGGVNRNSDPTIGATVNALARLGAMLTLPNPVGLYMDHIDVSGWETADGSAPEEWVSIVRGRPAMIERLLVKPPPGSSKLVSDLRIAGEPVRLGGQIAECITVKLIGGARDIGKIKDNVLLACTNGCCISAEDGAELGLMDPHAPPLGTVAALTPEGGYLPPDAKAARPLVLARSARRRVPYVAGPVAVGEV